MIWQILNKKMEKGIFFQYYYEESNASSLTKLYNRETITHEYVRHNKLTVN